MLELRRLGGCSALIVSPDRSAVDGPLFGRNFDFDPMDILHDYSLVMVYRPEGKRPFAAVGFPTLGGVLSGMNDAGLAVATLDVYESSDGSPMFDPQGVPLAFTFRRILEECATVEEAEELLRSTKATTWMNLAVSDERDAAVFEITPRTVAVRRPHDDLLTCTNHFRADELATSINCRRYGTLEKSRDHEKLGIEDVSRMMHAVHQGSWTIQTMIFEPKSRKLHLSLGAGPTSARPLRTLELMPLFERGKDERREEAE
jgi:isopenicillin-N N-acyltransferase like protein